MSDKMPAREIAEKLEREGLGNASIHRTVDRIDPEVRVLAAQIDGIARRVSGSADTEDRITLERAADKLRGLHLECVELRRQVLDYGERCSQLFEERSDDV